MSSMTQRVVRHIGPTALNPRAYTPSRIGRRALRELRAVAARRRTVTDVWIDVGAHHGEKTLGASVFHRRRLVFAFEPNLDAFRHLVGRSRNYVALPWAVSSTGDLATLHVTRYEDSSSLLPVVEAGRERWIGGEDLVVIGERTVPTIRLDTFMDAMRIDRVSRLKVDAQGADLDVVRSAGARLRDIERVELEVAITGFEIYDGQATRGEILDFMSEAGFRLVKSERQSHDQEENLYFSRLGT